MSAVPVATPTVGKTAAKVRAITEAAMEQAAAEPRVIVPVPVTRVKEAEFERATWIVYPDDDVTVEDFANPKLWAHAAQDGPRKWRMYDLVEILQTRRRTLAIVVDEGVDYTNLQVLDTWELPPQRSTQERRLRKGYSIQHGRPGQDPYLVVRDSDGYAMSAGQGFRSYEAAFRWGYEHPAIGPERIDD